MVIVGVDPGKLGGIAQLDLKERTLGVFPMPVLGAGAGGKDELDEDSVLSILRYPGIIHAFVEKAAAMPKNGSVSMFSYGMGYGGLRMAIRAVGVPRTLVRPQDWMKSIGVTGKKSDGGDALFQRACDLMPECRPLWVSQYKRGGAIKESRKDGLVDASLIAYYGAISLGHVISGLITPAAVADLEPAA